MIAVLYCFFDNHRTFSDEDRGLTFYFQPSSTITDSVVCHFHFRIGLAEVLVSTNPETKTIRTLIVAVVGRIRARVAGAMAIDQHAREFAAERECSNRWRWGPRERLFHFQFH